MSKKYLGVVSFLIILTIAYIDRINVAVLNVNPEFLAHFGLTDDRTKQGTLMTVFLIGYGIASIFLTPFFESKFGYKKGLIVSLLLWGVLTFISPLAGTILSFLILRALLGISEGPLFSLKVMYVNDNFPATQRGVPNAISSMGVSIGLALGFSVIGYLLQNYGWQASFHYLALANIIVGIPLVLLFIHEDSNKIRNSTKSPVLIFKEALSVEKIYPILLIEIFTLSYLWGSSSWLPSYLVSDKGFSIKDMGLIASLPFIISICANLLGGILVDKIGQHRTGYIFLCSATLCALSVFGLMNAQQTATIIFFLLSSSFFWGLQSASIPTIVQRYSPPSCVGSAYGFINGIGNIVASLMPFLMGSMMKTNVSIGFSLLVISQLLSALCGIFFITKGQHRIRTI